MRLFITSFLCRIYSLPRWDGSFMPGEIIQTSVQLLLNIVSVLCKSGNQSTLYWVVYAKGANPNQFIMTRKPVIYLELIWKSLFAGVLKDNKRRLKFIINIYWWYYSKRTIASPKSNSNNANWSTRKLFKLPYTCAFQACLANSEANSRHTYDVTIWLSRTTDNSNIFIRSREVRDNESTVLIKLHNL